MEKIQVCSNCNSPDVEYKAWVSVNNDLVKDSICSDVQDFWCNKCQAHHYLDDKEVPDNYEVELTTNIEDLKGIFIVIEKFWMDNPAIVTDDQGIVLRFDSKSEAQKRANECQDGMVVKLKTQ